MACNCGIKSKKKCQEYFDMILAKEFSDAGYWRAHRLTVDTYSLQHPEKYMISPKSFAAHLTGMCITMKYDNNPQLFRRLQQWLDGKKELEKPDLLDHVGGLTIAHVINAKNGEEHITLVKEWAADVWKAYAVYHDLAKHWIELGRQ